MSNRVSEHFNEIREDFGRRASGFVAKEAERLGFVVKDEIWRGLVYEQKKVGTVVARGLWQGRPAVLKLQGLKPVVEEAELIRQFEKQNQSDRIRVPEVFYDEPWNSGRGYGLMIMEEIAAPPLYKKPWANAAERAAFIDFYDEFRSRAVTVPWLTQDEREKSTERFLTSRLLKWRELNQAVPPTRRLVDAEQEALIGKFELVVKKFDPEVPMIFGHGHLGPEDIRVESHGHYILLSNFFWSWRPQWYDLAFNVWAALLALEKEEKPVLEQAERLVAEWLRTYQNLSATKKDKDFEKHFNFMLLERYLGSVLIDLVLAEREPAAEAKREIQLAITHELAKRLIVKLQ